MTIQQPNVYLNGEFLPLADAKIPVLDRGFLFGDGVYEVIPAYAGQLFRLSQHLQRLDDSLRAIRMGNPLHTDEWRSLLETLIGQRPGEDQSVYLQVTRGAAETRDHAIPEGIAPTIFAMTAPIPPVDPALASKGIKAITLDDIRWRLCNIKATTLLANVLFRQQAKEEQAMEAILIRDGLATEGAASNLFVVSDGLLITPPKSHHLLPGITRDLVLELADNAAVPLQQREIPEQELINAEEVWLTSSTKEIMPVTRLNDQPVGDGKPGALFRKMSGIYSDYKERIKAGKES
jgi:D-alanine transaminase